MSLGVNRLRHEKNQDENDDSWVFHLGFIAPLQGAEIFF
jgi:hypothetical protein